MELRAPLPVDLRASLRRSQRPRARRPPGSARHLWLLDHGRVTPGPRPDPWDERRARVLLPGGRAGPTADVRRARDPALRPRRASRRAGAVLGLITARRRRAL
jgi:hypothetical protein